MSVPQSVPRPRTRRAPGAPSIASANDTAYLAALRARDPEAVERLVRTESPRLLAVARRLLRNEADAQDALQEAFLSAFEGLGRFQGGSSLSTWLHRIVVNAALMKIRSRRRKPEGSIEDLLPGFLEDGHHEVHPRPWPAADSLLERREVRALVRASIDRLPSSYRTVLMLRDIEELDTAETARLLGLTPTTVKVRLHRARQALRTLLDGGLRRDDA
jgi:RNA polymerase sigma-70 factor (ECF subfamily)